MNSDWLAYHAATIFAFDDTIDLNLSSSHKWNIIQNKLKYINIILLLYMTMFRILYFYRQDTTENIVGVVHFLFKGI